MFNIMFHMINKRALLVEVSFTLVSLNFYLFQNNFATLRTPKWVMLRLKRFLLETLNERMILKALLQIKNSERFLFVYIKRIIL